MTQAVYPKTLDSTLEGRGYTAIDHTSVQLLSLSVLRQPLIHTVKVDDKLNDEWLNQFCVLNSQDESNKSTLKQMLSLILPRTCFILLHDNNAVVACGLGVLERGYLGIFDIVVDSRYRNLGFGEQLMLNLLNWGKENGAESAYLQVMLNNAPALRLYSKLGFCEKYRYWYRLKAWLCSFRISPFPEQTCAIVQDRLPHKYEWISGMWCIYTAFLHVSWNS